MKDWNQFQQVNCQTPTFLPPSKQVTQLGQLESTPCCIPVTQVPLTPKSS